MLPKSPACLPALQFLRNSRNTLSSIGAPWRKPLAAVGLAGLAAPAGTPAGARADQITYSIVNYPAAEKETINDIGAQDSISGTVTVISSTGITFGTPYLTSSSQAMALQMDFTFTLDSAPGSGQPSITFTDNDTLNDLLGNGSVTFTSSAMLLNNGYIGITSDNVGSNVTNGAMEWRSDEGLFQGTVAQTIDGFNAGPKTEFSDSNGLTDIGPSPWTIATAVPEPSAFALLAFPVSVFLLGRRRFRSAGN